MRVCELRDSILGIGVGGGGWGWGWQKCGSGGGGNGCVLGGGEMGGRRWGNVNLAFLAVMAIVVVAAWSVCS